jgi:hypothetical protein
MLYVMRREFLVCPQLCFSSWTIAGVKTKTGHHSFYNITEKMSLQKKNNTLYSSSQQPKSAKPKKNCVFFVSQTQVCQTQNNTVTLFSRFIT